MTSIELKAARKHLGYTQAKLAKALGLSANSVARYESKNGLFPIRRSIEILVNLLIERKEPTPCAKISDAR